MIQEIENTLSLSQSHIDETCHTKKVFVWYFNSVNFSFIVIISKQSIIF